MNKTIFVLGMLVVFAFTLFNVETAKADVDISGQCVQIDGCASPDEVCKAAGYYGCAETSGTFFPIWMTHVLYLRYSYHFP